jgi:hypothetical protein
MPAWGPADVPGARPTPAPSPGGGPAKPGAVLGDVKARRRQRGRAVRVRVSVLTAGADVRVKLIGARRKPVRSTAARGSAARRVTIGAAVKRGAPVGRHTFKVPLNRRGRAALRRSGKVKLSVRVAVTAPGGAHATAARKVTLRR